jgi:hypothetical protein
MIAEQVLSAAAVEWAVAAAGSTTALVPTIAVEARRVGATMVVAWVVEEVVVPCPARPGGVTGLLAERLSAPVRRFRVAPSRATRTSIRCLAVGVVS